MPRGFAPDTAGVSGRLLELADRFGRAQADHPLDRFRALFADPSGEPVDRFAVPAAEFAQRIAQRTLQLLDRFGEFAAGAGGQLFAFLAQGGERGAQTFDAFGVRCPRDRPDPHVKRLQFLDHGFARRPAPTVTCAGQPFPLLGRFAEHRAEFARARLEIVQALFRRFDRRRKVLAAVLRSCPDQFEEPHAGVGQPRHCAVGGVEHFLVGW